MTEQATTARPPGWPGCPTCVPDRYGRFPIGWCGPDCERRKRKAAWLAESAALWAELVEPYHGTRYGYHQLHCRCDRCSAFISAYYGHVWRGGAK